MHATDHSCFDPLASVIARMLAEAGFAVDHQAMNWENRANDAHQPLYKGGCIAGCKRDQLVARSGSRHGPVGKQSFIARYPSVARSIEVPHADVYC